MGGGAAVTQTFGKPSGNWNLLKFEQELTTDTHEQTVVPMSGLGAKPSFVECGAQRFLLVDAPTDVNVDAYIREFKAVNVTALVRACECGYSAEPIRRAGIAVHDMPFPDGDPVARRLHRDVRQGQPGQAIRRDPLVRARSRGGSPPRPPRSAWLRPQPLLRRPGQSSEVGQSSESSLSCGPLIHPLFVSAALRAWGARLCSLRLR